MATSKFNPFDCIAGEANEDLSSSLHLFAKAVDGNKIGLAGDGGNVLGVIVEAAASGYGVTVQTGGIGKAIAGSSITANDDIASDADGKAVPAATGDFSVGVARNTVSAGELVSFAFGKGGAAA